jgi:hypothetical protein
MFDDRSSDENRITHAGSAERTVGAWVPLPEHPTAATERSSRDESERYRRARRRSRLTSGALIVGSGAAAVTLAYQLLPPAPPPVGTVASTGGVGATTVSSTGTGPRVTHTVATTSASGVTTYTTTQVVNGRTVVTHVRHVSTSSYHDD